MEEDVKHSHLVGKESGTSPEAGKGSSSHNTLSQGKDPTHERESSATEHKGHHQQHHHLQHSSSQPETTTTSSSSITAMTHYNANVQFDPTTPKAGKPTNLSLVVTEQKVGEPIKHFDKVHDKLMHLIIVNKEDLSHFAHIHPKLNRELGIFYIVHAFAKAGKYKMWIDVKPTGGKQTVTALAFNVEGQPIHSPTPIAHEQTRVKNVHVEGQSYQVALNCQPEQLVAGRNIKMTFEI